MKARLLSAVFGATFALTSFNASAATLDDVKTKGFVQCGVSQGLPGFSVQDQDGNFTGIDVDFCRAVAAAVLGDASKVQYTPLSSKERFTVLASGDIDLLSRNTTWTATRDTQLGLNFAGVNYYDGQGFLVPKSLGVSSALELSSAPVCIETGTTTELNLTDFFASNDMELVPVTFEKADEAVAAYESGRCLAYTTDSSALYAQRLKLSNPDAHIVLPEIISKEPLGPVVRQGDDQWFNIVRWTLNAMINAEELGVTSKNIEEMKASTSPEIKRLLGIEGAFGEGMGISNDWALNIISQVGNYAEVFDANVGPDTRLGISRGVNALWNQGGILYAAPIR